MKHRKENNMNRKAHIKDVEGNVLIIDFVKMDSTTLVHFRTQDGCTYFTDISMVEILPEDWDEDTQRLVSESEYQRLRKIDLQMNRLLDTCSMFREHAKDKADLSSCEIDYSYYRGIMSGIWKVKVQIETILKGDSDDERHQKD